MIQNIATKLSYVTLNYTGFFIYQLCEVVDKCQDIFNQTSSYQWVDTKVLLCEQIFSEFTIKLS